MHHSLLVTIRSTAQDAIWDKSVTITVTPTVSQADESEGALLHVRQHIKPRPEVEEDGGRGGFLEDGLLDQGCVRRL